MKVLIADKFEAAGIEGLRAAGCEVEIDPGLQGDALGAALARGGAAVLIVRSTPVTAEMFAAAPQLALVVRAGAGYNTIDVPAASRHGVLVANCPGKNAVAVAELTFALILALDRRIVENVCDLRNGVWNKKEYSQARGLKDRTLGIVGMGQIGRAVARRARAFEMNVVAWSRSLTDATAAELGVARCADPAEVASRCDILSIHLAAAPETRKLIDADVLGRLAPGSYVINTARADVMDYAALAEAVARRGLRVGLDVFPDEPTGGQGAFSDALVRSGAVVYGTHHIGASTEQAQNAIAEETVRLVRMFRETGKVDHCVNLCPRSSASRMLVVRHRNQPGVLAHVLSHLSAARINVEEMENVIFAEQKTASARIGLDGAPEPALLERIRTGCEHILAISLVELPP